MQRRPAWPRAHTLGSIQSLAFLARIEMRRQLARLLEVLPRLRTRARLLQRERESVVRVGVVGRKLDRLPELCDRGSPIAALQFLTPDTHCERGSLGVGLAASEAVCF